MCISLAVKIKPGDFAMLVDLITHRAQLLPYVINILQKKRCFVNHRKANYD